LSASPLSDHLRRTVAEKMKKRVGGDPGPLRSLVRRTCGRRAPAFSQLPRFPIQGGATAAGLRSDHIIDHRVV
jgi:hypothetical protein